MQLAQHNCMYKVQRKLNTSYTYTKINVIFAINIELPII